MTDYETLQQAAARHDVSSKTIRRRIEDGSLKGYRFGPRLIRVIPADVDALFSPVEPLCPGCIPLPDEAS